MDVSPEYAKMCTAAAEIQQARPKVSRFALADFFECPNHGIILLAWMAIGQCCGTPENPVPKVWLPRQDQLQGMVDEDWGNDIASFAFAFHVFIHEDRGRKLSCVGYTWEQLWLAYVMYEKYQKCWTGEEWVKE